MTDFCKYKFSVPVDAISISHTLYEVPYENHEKLVFEFLDDDFTETYDMDLSDIRIPVIDMLHKDTVSVAASKCLDRLQSNANAI